MVGTLSKGRAGHVITMINNEFMLVGADDTSNSKLESCVQLGSSFTCSEYGEMMNFYKYPALFVVDPDYGNC